MDRVFGLQKSLIRVTIALSIYGFATSLVGIFLPLVVLTSGGELWQIAAFYLVYAVVKLVINYPVVLVLQRQGAKFGLAIAFISGGLHLLSVLGFIDTGNWAYLAISGLLLSVANAFLWNAQHLFISKMISEEIRTSSITTLAILGQLSAVIVPVLGGLIGAFFGPIFLFVAAAAVCLLAVFSLSLLERLPHEPIAEKITYGLHGAPVRDIMANFFFNMETSVGMMVWPIYMAVFVATYKSIGLIASIAACTTVIVTWMAGHRGHKVKERTALTEGAAVSSILHAIRIYATSQWGIAVITSSYRASLAYFQNAWTSTYYHHAKYKGLQYIMSMEIACDLAYVVLWSALLLLSINFSVHTFFLVAFVLAAIAAWGSLLITKQGVFEPPGDNS